MKTSTALVAAIGAGALLIYTGRSLAAAFGIAVEDDGTMPWLSPPSPAQVSQEIAAMTIDNSTPEARVSAFLALIRKYESGGRYDVLYGGDTFSDFSQHPN